MHKTIGPPPGTLRQPWVSVAVVAFPLYMDVVKVMVGRMVQILNKR